MPQNAAINSRFLTQKNTGQVVSSLHMLPPRILVFSYTTAAKHSNTVQQDRQNTFTQGPILGESKPSITYTANPFPVMIAGISLCSNSHREFPVMNT